MSKNVSADVVQVFRDRLIIVSFGRSEEQVNEYVHGFDSQVWTDNLVADKP